MLSSLYASFKSSYGHAPFFIDAKLILQKRSSLSHWSALRSSPFFQLIKTYGAKMEDKPDISSRTQAKNENPASPSCAQDQDKQQSATTERLKSLETSLQEKEDRYKELHNAYLVALADMENLRMRTKKEVENSATYSITKLAKELLPVVDVLELALAAVPASLRSSDQPNPCSSSMAQTTQNDCSTKVKESLASLYTGVELTLHELRNVLQRNGIEGFDALNAPFDPNCHMALYDMPCPDGKPPGIVIDVQKKGYTLKNRILRPAQVGITKS